MASHISTSVVVAVALLVAATSAAALPWQFTYRTMSTKYVTYGGTLGDPVQPTAKDKKLAFAIRGSAAQEIFEAIGPDVRSCSGDATRERTKGDIDCVYAKADGYTCWAGFDLRTGKSIGGSVC